jgi:LDH2 family malate/lactate/ureidoglycolate dehydrogenase
VTVAVEELERFVAELLAARGVASERAGAIAALMAKADRYGVATHGVARLGSYLARIDAGVMELDPAPRIVEERAATALLDAGNGWGQVAAGRAMRLAVEKATSAGIGAVSVANSNHFGVAGHYAEMATEAGCIGVAMTNASPAMAPFNAKVALLGTNPIAFGVPMAGDAPVILDMSSSLVARGKIRRAFKEGAERIPEGWAVDAEGRPTTDPAAALAGLLAPIGGAKGTGLALIIDILSGLLSGTGPTGEVANITDASRPSRTGHLLIAIDPDAFIGRGVFEAAVAETGERIRAMEAADGGRVLLPGQLEHERAERIAADGVALPADVRAELDSLAERYGVAPPAERD